MSTSVGCTVSKSDEPITGDESLWRFAIGCIDKQRRRQYCDDRAATSTRRVVFYYSSTRNFLYSVTFFHFCSSSPAIFVFFGEIANIHSCCSLRLAVAVADLQAGVATASCQPACGLSRHRYADVLYSTFL